MRYERWLRIGAAASVLLLVLAAGALAGQWRTSREAAQLRAQLAQLREDQRKPAAPPPATSQQAASPVALTRVRVVPEQVSGSFSVQATVSNRSKRTLSQPVHGLLIISDPENPEKEPNIQSRQAVIESLSPGDTTTVVLKGFEASDPKLRHEVVVSTPAVDPDRTGATVMKVVPDVAPSPQTRQSAQPSPAPAPAPARQQPSAPPQTPPQPSPAQPSPPAQPAPPAQDRAGQDGAPMPAPQQQPEEDEEGQQPGAAGQQQPKAKEPKV